MYAKNFFQKLCLAILFFALFVILWGAWVRFSHSGDGCGAHWPLCHDQWVPYEGSQKTWMEWIHRASSGLFGLLVLSLTFFSFKYFPRKHKVRLYSIGVLFFTCTEALIGALLVLGSFTGQNASLMRVVILNTHLINSLLLIACLVFCWRSVTPVFQKISFQKIAFFGGIFIFIASTGSIASLSNTLFPSTSLVQGFFMDWDFKNSPWIVQLRLLHPLMAVLLGGMCLYYLSNRKKTFFQKIYFLLTYLFSFKSRHTFVLNLSKNLILAVLFLMGLFTGAITLFTLSPVLMKLIHLFIAYLIWIFIFLL